MNAKIRIVVVGAGPAGMQAAVTAKSMGAEVILVDDNPQPGGQIWRKHLGKSAPPRMTDLQNQLNELNVPVITGARVAESGDHFIVLDVAETRRQLSYTHLILATGARELFLPYPGWTLPGVMGPGGLQALVKSGLNISGKNVLIAGTGPLMLAVAKTLNAAGANLLGILEQASKASLMKFALQTFTSPAKLKEAFGFAPVLLKTKMQNSSWVKSVSPKDNKLVVKTSVSGGEKELTCDFVACAFGLVPNAELARSLGCRVEKGIVSVNEKLESSQPHVYAVGESNGVGGLDKALAEGRAAVLSALDIPWPQSLKAEVDKGRSFTKTIRNCFALRPEVKNLADKQTIICRCEDVTLERVKQHKDIRTAKIMTRCGMGACQGRVCGSALTELLGWNPRGSRPPTVPVKLNHLAEKSKDTVQEDPYENHSG